MTEKNSAEDQKTQPIEGWAVSFDLVHQDSKKFRIRCR